MEKGREGAPSWQQLSDHLFRVNLVWCGKCAVLHFCYPTLDFTVLAVACTMRVAVGSWLTAGAGAIFSLGIVLHAVCAGGLVLNVYSDTVSGQAQRDGAAFSQAHGARASADPATTSSGSGGESRE